MRGLYLKRASHNRYYVGITNNLTNRYPSKKERDSVLLFVESQQPLIPLEHEAVEFCKGVGLPLANIHLNNPYTKQRKKGRARQW